MIWFIVAVAVYVVMGAVIFNIMQNMIKDPTELEELKKLYCERESDIALFDKVTEPKSWFYLSVIIALCWPVIFILSILVKLVSIYAVYTVDSVKVLVSYIKAHFHKK